MTSTDRARKSKAKKRLEKLNEEIKNNDIKNIEKKILRNTVELRESINLSNKGCSLRYKQYVQNLIKENFTDGDTCFFFSLCHEFGVKVDMVQNDRKVKKFLTFLDEQQLIEKLIIIPEYHHDISRVHNHGVIRIPVGKGLLFKKVLKEYWSRFFKGSHFSETLDTDKRFEEYLTKYLTYDYGKFSPCDSIHTMGINLNSVKETVVKKIKLTSIGNIRPQQSDDNDLIKEEDFEESEENIVANCKQDTGDNSNIESKLFDVFNLFRIINYKMHEIYEIVKNLDFNNLQVQINLFDFFLCVILITSVYNLIL